MKTITKAMMAKKIAAKTGNTQAAVEEVLDILIYEIRNAMKQGDQVVFRGLGTFFLKHRKAKVGQDINRAKPVQIPAKMVPSFRMAKRLKDVVGLAITKTLN